MIFDGDMAVDTVVIHPIPIPELFAQGRSATRIVQVALAFDPPVRRQRREYLAGAMQLDLYRAIDIDDLADIVSRQDPDDPNPPIRDRRRVRVLKPGPDSFAALPCNYAHGKPGSSMPTMARLIFFCDTPNSDLGTKH